MRRIVWIGLLFAVLVFSSEALATKIFTGTYIGNGGDNRDIAVAGMNASSGASVYVRIVNDSTLTGANKFGIHAGDAAFSLAAGAAPAANIIQDITTNSFQVGSATIVNNNGVKYYYLVIEDDGQDDICIGYYIGNGVDDTNITVPLAGVAPDYVFVRPISANAEGYHIDSMGDTNDVSKRGTSLSLVAGFIQQLLPDAFQVGSSVGINQSGSTFFYIAVVKDSSVLQTGTYFGNVTDDRNISAGIDPTWVEVSGNTTQNTWVKTSAMTGTTSVPWINVAGTEDMIQAINVGGFQVGTNIAVNGSGTSYYWTAWKDGTSGGAATPATKPKGTKATIMTRIKEWLMPKAWAGRNE